jgi:hypothetical protein
VAYDYLGKVAKSYYSGWYHASAFESSDGLAFLFGFNRAFFVSSNHSYGDID